MLLLFIHEVKWMDAINAENFHSLSIFNVTVIVMSKMSAMTKCRTKMPVWVYENNNPSCRRTVSQVFLFTADLIWSTQIYRHNNISYRILVTWAVEWWIITYGASYVSKSYIDIYKRRRLSKVLAAAWMCSVRDCRRAEHFTLAPWKLKLRWRHHFRQLHTSSQCRP